METCRRCSASIDVPPGAPCPRCGTILEITAKSPLAATTERPAPAALMTMPSALPALPTPVASAPYPFTNPAAPAPYAPAQLAPVQPNAATMLPQGQPPYAQAPMPYGYAPPIQVIVQNQIQMPPAMMPAQYVVPAYPPVHYVRRKDPGVAVLCSFFLPGGGQLYNGQVGKGLAFICASVINFLLLFIGIGFLTGLGTWIWSMIDAHGTAERINRGEIVPS